LSPELQEGVEVVGGDLERPETLGPVVEGVGVVIHAAGMLGHWGLPYQALWNVNVQGTENLIRAAAQAGVSRFLHLSTGGVSGPKGFQPTDETCPPNPYTDYERSKWEGECRAVEVAAEVNLPLLVLRPTFTYGPADPHKLGLFRMVQKRLFFFIGDGLSTVTPVYIDDLVQGIDLALKSGMDSECFILGGERPVTKRELVWGIADALQVSRPALKVPAPVGWVLARGCEAAASVFRLDPPLTRSRIMALSRCWGYSIDYARRKLGYEPKVNLEEGLRRTAQWYRGHQWL